MQDVRELSMLDLHEQCFFNEILGVTLQSKKRIKIYIIKQPGSGRAHNKKGVKHEKIYYV